jgi:hypothetical protein
LKEAMNQDTKTSEIGGLHESSSAYAEMNEENATQRHSSSAHETVSMPIVNPEDLPKVWFCSLLALIVALAPFILVPLVCAEDVCHGKLPLFLALAYTLFCAYVLGRVATAVQLPNVLGYLIAGFILQFISPKTLVSASPTLQTLVFVLGVLVRAGLELDFADMNYVTVSLGVLPVMADAATIAVCAVSFMDFSLVEAGALAFIMAPLGDGLVIPAMLQLKDKKLGPMPRLLFTAAPIEAVTGLFVFGVFANFAEQEKTMESTTMVVLLGILVKFVATICFSYWIAFILTYIVEYRSIFTSGGDSEELLFVLSGALVAYSLANEKLILIPNGYEGPLLQQVS